MDFLKRFVQEAAGRVCQTILSDRHRDRDRKREGFSWGLKDIRGVEQLLNLSRCVGREETAADLNDERCYDRGRSNQLYHQRDKQDFPENQKDQ